MPLVELVERHWFTFQGKHEFQSKHISQLVTQSATAAHPALLLRLGHKGKHVLPTALEELVYLYLKEQQMLHQVT